MDLGQSQDPTAIAVLHHQEHEQFVVSTRRVERTETFDVRYLTRLPLGGSYVDVVSEVARLYSRPPLYGNCELVIDDTGVGRAVGDLFSDAGLDPLRVTITSGTDQNAVGNRRWHVAKAHLVSLVDAKLHVGELRFAAGMSESSTLQEELKDFRRKVSAAGRYSFEARVGKHDDLVLAVAIGLWAIVGRPKPAGPYFGSY